MLSGLLLNVALYAVLRFKMLLAANPAALAPGPLMVTLGLVSLIFAALHAVPPPRHQADVRLFLDRAMGIIAFAFGMGGPLANFAGLLHMTMHSLTKSAIFFAVGHIAQVKGTQRIADIGGLTETHPVLGWGLVLGVVAIAGMPPFGIFISEFLVVSSTFARAPLLALPLVFGLLVAFGALLLRLQRPGLRRAARRAPAPVKASYVPMFAHLALVLLAGIYLPPPLVDWFQHVAKLLGIDRCHGDLDRARSPRAARSTAHRPWPRVDRRRERLARLPRELATGADAARAVGRTDAVHMALLDDAGAASPSSARLPRRRAFRPSARCIRRRSGSSARSATLRPRARRRCRHAALARSRPLGRVAIRWRRRRRGAGRRRPYAFLPAEGEGLHQIPVGPVHAGIIEPGHFRFTANGETVVRLEERLGYVTRASRR